MLFRSDLLGLAHGLQAVTKPFEKGGRRTLTDLMPKSLQFSGQRGRTLGTSAQRTLQMAPGGWVHQSVECSEHTSPRSPQDFSNIFLAAVKGLA